MGFLSFWVSCEHLGGNGGLFDVLRVLELGLLRMIDFAEYLLMWFSGWLIFMVVSGL